MATGIRIQFIRIPAVCFWMHIVLVSIRFYAKVLNSLNFSQRVMGYLEKYRIFVPELRRSLHIAKYRNEQKSARFHIVTYIIQANDQLLDFQSKSNLERVTVFNSFRIESVLKIALYHTLKLGGIGKLQYLCTVIQEGLCTPPSQHSTFNIQH